MRSDPLDHQGSPWAFTSCVSSRKKTGPHSSGRLPLQERMIILKKHTRVLYESQMKKKRGFPFVVVRREIWKDMSSGAAFVMCLEGSRFSEKMGEGHSRKRNQLEQRRWGRSGKFQQLTASGAIGMKSGLESKKWEGETWNAWKRSECPWPLQTLHVCDSPVCLGS